MPTVARALPAPEGWTRQPFAGLPWEPHYQGATATALASRTIPVHLPKASTGATPTDQKPLAVAVDESGALFVEQTGERPVGFRSPAWEMTPHMLSEIKRLGLAYDSSLSGADGCMTVAPAASAWA